MGRLDKLRNRFWPLNHASIMTSCTLISTLLQVLHVYVGIINSEMLFPDESMLNCDFDTRVVAVKKSWRHN